MSNPSPRTEAKDRKRQAHRIGHHHRLNFILSRFRPVEGGPVLVRGDETLQVGRLAEYLRYHRQENVEHIGYRPLKRVACAEVMLTCETLPAPPPGALSKQEKSGGKGIEQSIYWPTELAVSIPQPDRPRRDA